MGKIELINISKSFGDKQVISNINITVEEGSFTVLLGSSGCGKTTTLRMVSGLERPDSGKIIINGKDVTNKNSSKRGISMVFQSYALFPHLNVKDNILFGLRVRKVNKQEQKIKLQRVEELLGLERILNSKPSQLSGGQKQRVALARALVAEHSICLMDEPLSNLDAELRHKMRIEIKSIQKRLGITVLYVTHDQIEAMSMADHIILLNGGKIEQQGTHHSLYDRPATIFAAKFIGTPPMNILNKDEITLLKDEMMLPNKSNDKILQFNFLDIALENQWYIGIRPEDIVVNKSQEGIKGKIVFQHYLGSDTILGIQIKGKSELLSVRIRDKNIYNNGDVIWISWLKENTHIFDSNGKREKECNQTDLNKGKKFKKAS